MSTTYQVVDCRPDGKTTTVVARTPEEAAAMVLGQRLVRSGQRAQFRAKAYFEGTEARTTVRLYATSPAAIPDSHSNNKFGQDRRNFSAG